MQDVPSSGRGRLGLAGGLAAILAVAIFVMGIVGLAIGSPSLRPWLAVLFGINAAVGAVSLGTLRAANPVDIAVLVLTAVTFIGFWPGPGKPHKIWMGVAIALPLAGIAVLLATGLWGRSGLMGGGLVLSLLMLGDRAFRPLGFLGIAANSLLLVGDFATGGSSVPVIAALVAVGYLLLLVWFVWIAARLLSAKPSPCALQTT